NELIKRYQPRFNVRLKDDKSYPYIKIHWQDPFPKISITRRIQSDGARYYGPFTSAWAVRQTLDALRRIFPYLSCSRPITGKDSRPCLYYHLKRCAGPCIGAVSQEEYREIIQGLADFLEGHAEKVIAELRARMQKAADELQFERAALYRDQIRAAEFIAARQQTVGSSLVDQDVIAFAREDRDTCVQVFFVRNGKLIGREFFLLEGVGEEKEAEIMSSFLKQFYDEAAFVPSEILLPIQADEVQIIESWLWHKSGQRVTLQVPQNGPPRRLVKMAAENALETLNALRSQWQADTNQQLEALVQLQEALGLESPPARIECYDISTLQGRDTVGSMVVFVQGTPRKSDYRRFRVRGLGALGEPNDYASMREVLRRRFRRAVEKENASDPGSKARASDAAWKLLPNLLLVDGGKGQLNVAVEVLEEFGLSEVVPAVGLAKRHEELFVPGRSDPIVLPPGSQGLFLVQRIRDEAHRFAVTYHRSRRRQRTTTSVLDDIPGIGPKRRQALLRRFGSLEAIRQASLEELAAVPGMTWSAAQAVKDQL
ncbi:MAG TPA: excinuclease ABC subunit UvrC, partial [Anaerolineae bacterium]|nr:excinuclease ABC subunit UvrC [Anaerolineae bacterium]